MKLFSTEILMVINSLWIPKLTAFIHFSSKIYIFLFNRKKSMNPHEWWRRLVRWTSLSRDENWLVKTAIYSIIFIWFSVEMVSALVARWLLINFMYEWFNFIYFHVTDFHANFRRLFMDFPNLAKQILKQLLTSLSQIFVMSSWFFSSWKKESKQNN